MPKVNEIIKSKNFKKTAIRPWDDSFSKTKIKTIKNEDDELKYIDTNYISIWEHKDRRYFDSTELNELANDLKVNKQQMPCIVRPISNKNGFYELIVGERRYKAAQLAGIKLLVVVRNYSDFEAAISQASENEHRKDLTDYERGKSYYHLINKRIITRDDLIKKLNKNEQYISALLSFNHLHQKVFDAIGDFSKVSAYTAEKIKQLSSKGEDYISAIIDLAHLIRLGKIGHSSLENKILKSLKKKNENSNNSHNIFLSDGELGAIIITKANKITMEFTPLLRELYMKDNIKFLELFSKMLISIEKK